ncbi:MAG TPA: AgmX/PglI C-terminal domain-containing protein, partial [Myxococcaceae bacterium]|nr:AgmX/PglI C-terminal domain-containing protein [Myxococcaceae bacterium]
GGFYYFLSSVPARNEADFQTKNVAPVAVRLIAPEAKKKEKAQERLKKIKEAAAKKKESKKPERRAVEKAERPQPKKESAPQANPLKALAKLTAGPASKNIFNAVDKLNAGGAKKDSGYKLSGLIGKGPVANAGLGGVGIGVGKGGGGTMGSELLRGKGGGGIGALGAGGVGRGAVGGTVSRASARTVSVQGSIDRDAVAKAVNSHLQEVRACYEKALLRDPSLAGKVVLEWTISTAGRVVSTKTKSSTLRNGAVESCILQELKGWQFPSAKGGTVIVSYPFLFNSVGY